MQREPACADKSRGKEIVFLRHFPQMQIVLKFHHVDPPDYLMFAQDDRAEKCTRMLEEGAQLLH